MEEVKVLAGTNSHSENRTMDAAMKSPPDERESKEWRADAPPDTTEASTGTPVRAENVGELRAEVERLQQREHQIMSLIGCKNQEKLMHDLRNVLNELQLLRMLAETDRA